MLFGVIYKITNKINGKVYLGQTTGNPAKRIADHFNIKSKKPSLIRNAVKCYSKENFVVEVICSCSNLSDLNYCEELLISQNNSVTPNGYNILPGGGNREFPDYVKEKISKTKKCIPNLHLKGKPKSDEHREKLRLAKLGKKQTKEHARNSALARSGENHWLFGKKQSPETIEKMKKTKTGVPLRTDLVESYTKRINEAAKKIRKPIYSPTMGLYFESIADASKLLDIPEWAIHAHLKGRNSSKLMGETFVRVEKI